jgi:hypothetical protein
MPAYVWKRTPSAVHFVLAMTDNMIPYFCNFRERERERLQPVVDVSTGQVREQRQQQKQGQSREARQRSPQSHHGGSGGY